MTLRPLQIKPRSCTPPRNYLSCNYSRCFSSSHQKLPPCFHSSPKDSRANVQDLIISQICRRWQESSLSPSCHDSLSTMNNQITPLPKQPATEAWASIRGGGTGGHVPPPFGGWRTQYQMSLPPPPFLPPFFLQPTFCPV